MLRCTYIVLIEDNTNNIINLIASLKKITGNFRKEFIFVVDGSVDDSLIILKKSVSGLPRSTIITQEKQGSSISINKALSLNSGDYIQFVEGSEILHPDSTNTLIESCIKFGAEVAIGNVSKKTNNDKKLKDEPQLIDVPLKIVLDNSIPCFRQVGKAGSLISKSLLEKIGEIDNSIYTHNMSLSLECAKYSKFAYIDEDVSAIIDDTKQDSDNKFVAYNNLRSTYNFAKNNPDLFKNLIPELLKNLSQESGKTSDKLEYSFKALASKYLKPHSIDKILAAYKKEFDNLF